MSSSMLVLRAELERRAARGDDIDNIDAELIQPLRIPDDQKAALWLLAWSIGPRRAARAREWLELTLAT